MGEINPSAAPGAENWKSETPPKETAAPVVPAFIASSLPSEFIHQLTVDYSSNQEQTTPDHQLYDLLHTIDTNLKGSDPSMRAEAGRMLNYIRQDRGDILAAIPDASRREIWNNYLDELWTAAGSQANKEWAELHANPRSEVLPAAELPPTLESVSFGKGVLLSDPRITPDLLMQARERVAKDIAANQRALDQDNDNVSVKIVMEALKKDLKTIDGWIREKEQKR